MLQHVAYIILKNISSHKKKPACSELAMAVQKYRAIAYEVPSPTGTYRQVVAVYEYRKVYIYIFHVGVYI